MLLCEVDLLVRGEGQNLYIWMKCHDLSILVFFKGLNWAWQWSLSVERCLGVLVRDI
jgi:hypothetical protein